MLVPLLALALVIGLLPSLGCAAGDCDTLVGSYVGNFSNLVQGESEYPAEFVLTLRYENNRVIAFLNHSSGDAPNRPVCLHLVAAGTL